MRRWPVRTTSAAVATPDPASPAAPASEAPGTPNSACPRRKTSPACSTTAPIDTHPVSGPHGPGHCTKSVRLRRRFIARSADVRRASASGGRFQRTSDPEGRALYTKRIHGRSKYGAMASGCLHARAYWSLIFSAMRRASSAPLSAMFIAHAETSTTTLFFTVIACWHDQPGSSSSDRVRVSTP